MEKLWHFLYAREFTRIMDLNSIKNNLRGGYLKKHHVVLEYEIAIPKHYNHELTQLHNDQSISTLHIHDICGAVAHTFGTVRMSWGRPSCFYFNIIIFSHYSNSDHNKIK